MLLLLSHPYLYATQGMCGTGKLGDAFTSGFEFPFTTNPTKWDNEYFVNLERYQVGNRLNQTLFQFLIFFQWEKYKGPGGHFQWKVMSKSKQT